MSTPQQERCELVKELCGVVCFCGAVKGARQTFCRHHYRSLTRPLRRALYDRLGDGYEEAYDAARKFFAAIEARLRKPAIARNTEESAETK